MTASHRFPKYFSSMFSDTYLSGHPGGSTPGTYTEGEETLTAIAPAPATAPRPWTASAHTRRTDPPHPAGPEGPPRRRSSDHSADGSAAREPSDTDPHEIPSSAVSAAPSAPRPRRQQPGGRPCTRTPMAPIESGQKRAKGGQKRPRSAGAARYDSRLRLPRFSASRFTDHGSRSFPIGSLGITHE